MKITDTQFCVYHSNLRALATQSLATQKAQNAVVIDKIAGAQAIQAGARHGYYYG